MGKLVVERQPMDHTKDERTDLERPMWDIIKSGEILNSSLRNTELIPNKNIYKLSKNLM